MLGFFWVELGGEEFAFGDGTVECLGAVGGGAGCLLRVG